MTKAESFRDGVVWNFASIALLAISGVFLNVAIGYFYDAAALGVFNQVLSAYFIFSMFAVGAINLSALKLISEDPSNEIKVRQVIVSSVLLTLLCSAVMTSIFWLSRRSISAWLQSPGVEEGMSWIAPGLFFFGLNKTLLWIVNGLHKMKAFAVFQGLRYLNLINGLILAIVLKFPGDRLAWVFSFSEGILCFALVIYLRKYWSLARAPGWTRWIPFHLHFGIKGILSGALLELNARVDILLLGYFLSDSKTGVYSLAALGFEGLMQFLIALQNNYNPRLSQWIHRDETATLREAFREGRRRTYKYALIALPAIALLFPVGVLVCFPNKPEFMDAWLPFAILMGGLLGASGYVPFHNILLMGGHPGWHTAFIAMNVTTNAILNVLFIPIWGIAGSALATALSLLFSNVNLLFLARSRLKIRLA